LSRLINSKSSSHCSNAAAVVVVATAAVAVLHRLLLRRKPDFSGRTVDTGTASSRPFLFSGADSH
jgi:hypothetical protein